MNRTEIVPLKVRIAARRADRLRLIAIGVIPIEVDYADLFTADDEAVEDWVEQEILASFGGFDALLEAVESELVGKRSMTAAEALAHLSAIAKKEE